MAISSDFYFSHKERRRQVNKARRKIKRTAIAIEKEKSKLAPKILIHKDSLVVAFHIEMSCINSLTIL